MESIIWLPKPKGYEAIFVVVDKLTKYNHFVSLKLLYSSILLANVFTKSVIHLDGISTSILSFCDPILVSSFWN